MSGNEVFLETFCIVILVTFYQIAILMELGNNEIQLKKENGEEMRGNNY